MSDKEKNKVPPEVAAIGQVHSALAGLEPDAQKRVLNYVAMMLRIASVTEENTLREEPQPDEKEEPAKTKAPESTQDDESPGQIEGISPVAKKWMVRNSLPERQLSSVFSLGVDEIDLIAKTVPGKSQKERVRSVALLKGIAAYLGTGATRFTHEQLKEACLHYKVYDATNFSKYMKKIASEVSGTASSGYMLTTRGIASATDLIKGMVQSGKSS